MGHQIVRAEREHALILGALTLQDDLADGARNRPGFIAEYADAWLAEYDRMPAWLAFADGGSAVGFVMASVVAKLPSLRRAAVPWVHVKSVFVTPEHRGRGVAEDLLRALLRWGDAQGIGRYQLNAVPEARALYERVGFGAPSGRLVERRREG